MLVLKPLVNIIILNLKGVKNFSYYTFECFSIRITEDCLYLFLCFFCFSSSLINFTQFMVVTMPVILLEVTIYFCSVLPAIKKTEKLHFRMIRDSITSIEENDAMWSSEDSDNGEN
jgi:hypothetical protein